MTEPDEIQKRRARVAASITVAFVVLFAFAFVGLISILNNLADDMQEPLPEGEIELAAEAPAEPFYVLLIGNDSRRGTAMYTGKASEHSQLDQCADVMTLMRVDPQGRLITLLSIPRDTVLDGDSEKINTALRSNNPEDVVDAVAELTGVRADYYMATTFIAFENLVNALGGIEVDVPETVSVPDPANGKSVTVKAGDDQHLDGSKALVLARARKDYDGEQDALRQVNVRAIEKALIEKVLEMDGSFDVEHVLAFLESDTKTDLDLPSAGLLMVDFVENADQVKIYEGTGPYETEVDKNGVVYVSEDRQAWTELMEVVNAGGDPQSVVKSPEF